MSRQFFLQVFILLFVIGYCYEYCDLKDPICTKTKRKHFSCEIEKQLPKPEFDFRTMYPITRESIKYFLHEHNRMRNLQAGGKVSLGNAKDAPLYPPAKRMRRVIWNNELAYTARLHAEYCVFGHDKCRDVKPGKEIGQNLAVGASRLYRNKCITELNFIYMFFAEANDSDNINIVNKLRIIEPVIGHWYQIILEKVGQLGCATSMCEQKPEKKKDKKRKSIMQILLTCHYDYISMLHEPAYEVGEPASNCDHWGVGKDATYEYLCDNNFD